MLEKVAMGDQSRSVMAAWRPCQSAWVKCQTWRHWGGSLITAREMSTLTSPWSEQQIFSGKFVKIRSRKDGVALVKNRGGEVGRLSQSQRTPSCPSRKDLLRVKVAKNRLTLSCGNAASDFVVLTMIKWSSQVRHPHLSKLHPPTLQQQHHHYPKVSLVFYIYRRVQFCL